MLVSMNSSSSVCMSVCLFLAMILEFLLLLDIAFFKHTLLLSSSSSIVFFQIYNTMNVQINDEEDEEEEGHEIERLHCNNNVSVPILLELAMSGTPAISMNPPFLR